MRRGELVEPLAEFFGMDTAPFRALTSEFRRRVIEEAAAADVALIVTLVWNLRRIKDASWVGELVSPTPKLACRSRSWS